jgi:cobalt-zinc-cadmium resistance protein CzcA
LPILYLYFEKGIKGKKKKISSVASLILLLFLAGNVNGQVTQNLTLETAIELGLKNNQQIKANEMDIQMQNQLKATAFEMSKTEFGSMLGQYNTRSFDQNYSISQSLSPFQFGAKKELINANIKSSELNLNLTKQEIKLTIRQSWNNLIYLLEVDKLLNRQDSLLLNFAKAALLKYEVGESNSLESTTAQVKQQELLQLIKQNNARIFVEKSKLKTLLNLQTDFTLNEKGLVILPAIAVTDSSSLKQNPELELAMQEVQKAMANQKLEKSMLLPDFKAGYFIQSLTGNQYVNGQSFYYNGSPRFQGVTIGVSIPIFAGSAIARKKAAETNIQMQQKNTEYLETQLKSQFQQQMEQLLTFQSLVEYYQNSALPSAKLISDNVSKSYKNGDISYIEFIQGIQTSLDIQANYLNALSNYNQTVINLQFLLNQ